MKKQAESEVAKEVAAADKQVWWLSQFRIYFALVLFFQQQHNAFFLQLSGCDRK